MRSSDRGGDGSESGSRIHPEDAGESHEARANVDAMMDGMRDALVRDEASGELAGLSVEDLADAVSHPKAPAVIAELMELEPSTVQAGASAPDFSLPWLQPVGEGEAERMTLSDHFGKRPVALIFGSYT